MKYEKSCWVIPVYNDSKNIFFLLVKWRHWHRWFPKWHVEQWEDCIDTALREFIEETGIPKEFISIKKDISYIDKYWFVLNSQKIFKEVIYFLWFLKKGFESHIKPQEGEISEIKLVSSNEISKFLEFKSLNDIVTKVVEYLKQISN